MCITLLKYFFGRFFENDVIQSNGDTITTVVRALSIAATPGLMLAFFLQNQYPQRSLWGRVEDHYFFVLYSMLVMAGVSIIEWEMLFPDRLDFLILTPMPLRGIEMLGAKAGALASFLGIFLVSANLFGAFVLPAVSRGQFWRQVSAQALAVACAGAFGALAVLAAGGLLLCVLPARAFRMISPALQMLLTAALGLFFVHYLRFGDSLDKVLRSPSRYIQGVPSFWFLGMYEHVLHGSSAPGFALPMMHHGLWAIIITSVIVIVTYPFAWVRMRCMAVEGEAGLRKRPAASMTGLVTNVVSPGPRRAVVYFIGQTMARNSRYQVYLAVYCGVGIALAIACATTFIGSGNGLKLAISIVGLHAVLPLLLFWAVAGLRMAFALPLNLPARWMFRTTGADREACISAARLWAMTCSLSILFVLLPLLWLAGLNARELFVQAVCGVCLCVIMVDGLLFADRGIPFTQPRSPDKTSLPLMLTLFIGVLPVFCFAMIHMEEWLEKNPVWLLWSFALVPTFHVTLSMLRRRSQPVLEDGDEIEGEFQLLNLGAE